MIVQSSIGLRWIRVVSVVGLMASWIATVTACQVKLAEQPPQPLPPGWESANDPLLGTSKPPETASLAYAPEAALGTLWAVKLIDGRHTCNELAGELAQATKLVESVPLGQFLSKECKVQTVGDRPVYSLRVSEGGAVQLGLGSFLGAKLEGTRAFELTISHPIIATFERESDCLPLDDIKKLQIDIAAGVCSLRWMKSAMLTTFTWRSFERTDADASGAYTLIKIDGNLYASREEIQQSTVLSGNYSELGLRIGRDPSTGNLVVQQGVIGVPGPPLPTTDHLPLTSEPPATDNHIFDGVRASETWKPVNLL